MPTIEPDMNLGHRFIGRHPPPGSLVYCAVSGAHLYGFASRDSDIDLKGVHAAPVETLLGLAQQPGVHNCLEVFEGVECDLTTLELGKALSLVLRGNGNTVEQIFSPYQLVPGQALDDLRELARDALSRRFYRHYTGFFRGMRREHENGSEPKAKTLLYSYRVALTGIHLLETGEVVAHLPALADRYGPRLLFEAIELKRAEGERATLPVPLDAALRSQWPVLQERLDEALERSPLPEEPPNGPAIEGWLVAFRLSQVRASTRSN